MNSIVEALRNRKDERGFSSSLDREAAYEIEKLQQWVDDLQSGVYINCVYCGHRYGPKEDTPTSMADILKQHIEQCPKHPLCQVRQSIYRILEKEQV